MKKTQPRSAYKNATGSKVLFHAKWHDAEAEEEGRSDLYGVTGGQSIRIVQRFYDDGTTGLFGDVSELTYRQRVSGKSFCYWRKTHTGSLRWTKAQLLLLRTASHESGSNGGHKSTYIFDQVDARGFFRHLLRHYDANRIFRRRRGAERVTLGPEDLGGYDQLLGALIDDLPNLIGGIPSFEERFRISAPTIVQDGTHRLFVDAADWREVTRRAFSQYNVKKPLVKAVARLEGRRLPWFRAFRGLVPIDWIIESMNRNDPSALERTPNVDERTLRKVLTCLPQPVLRRILGEPTSDAILTMRDASAMIYKAGTVNRDITPLNELITARGQKNIRSSRDVEQMIYHHLPAVEDPIDRNKRVPKRSLITQQVMLREARAVRDLERYNELVADLPDRQPITWAQWQDPDVQHQARGLMEQIRRERQTRRERERAERMERDRQRRMQEQADRAAWAAELTEKLHGLHLAGKYTIRVAAEPLELTRWGRQLGNCIGDYGTRIGLDVLGSIEDERGAMVLNFQVSQTRGLTQLLGKRNRDARTAVERDDAQKILDEMVIAGVKVDAKIVPLGAKGLRLPVATVAA